MCRAHAAAEQHAAQVQEALLSLQHRLHADKARRDKIMTALAAQSQQDSERQQSQQEEEEEDVLPQRTGKPQGTCTVTMDMVGPKL